MNNKIKIIIEHIIFVIIFVLLLTGCGAQLPIDNGEIALNGIAYTYYSKFSYENDVYRIYCIENENLQLLNGNIIYIYDEYNIEDYDSSINLWTINYLKNNKY